MPAAEVGNEDLDDFDEFLAYEAGDGVVIEVDDEPEDVFGDDKEADETCELDPSHSARIAKIVSLPL